MRARALFCVVGALIAAVALASASGAATTKAQKVTQIDVSTRSAVIHYLRSIHVNPKGAVIQRGARNYAGAGCPSGRWACARTKHTVVQITKRGGQNRFVCRSSHCVVVQLAGAGYISGRSLASTAASGGGNTASCIKTTGLVQSCVISQSNSTGNTAIVVEGQVAPGQKATGLTQTASYAAQVTQTSTSGLNKACVLQVTNMDGSTNTSGKKAQPITVTLEAHQSILITQDSSHGDNSARAATPAGGCDDTNGSAVTQQQLLSSTAAGSASITQKENAANSGFNLSLDIEQNQHTPSASGSNAANFTQTANQTAVAITPTGTGRPDADLAERRHRCGCESEQHWPLKLHGHAE